MTDEDRTETDEEVQVRVEHHLTQIRSQHQQLESIKEKKAKETKEHQDNVSQARSSRDELIEQPAPGTKQDLLKRVRAVQSAHQDVVEAKSGHADAKNLFRGLLKGARERLKVLIEMDINQMDLFAAPAAGGNGAPGTGGGDGEQDEDEPQDDPTNDPQPPAGDENWMV